MENKTDRAPARSRKQDRETLRRQKHTRYGDHQSGRQNRLRRRDRQQSLAQSGRHPELDQLRQSRARRITRRQTSLQLANQTVRLLGQIQILIALWPPMSSSAGSRNNSKRRSHSTAAFV